MACDQWFRRGRHEKPVHHARSLAISRLPLFADNSQRTVDFKTLAEIKDQVAYVPRREEVEANTFYQLVRDSYEQEPVAKQALDTL